MDAQTDTVALQLQALSEQVAWLQARQERQDELWAEFMPIGREVMNSLTGKLAEAEKRGYLDFGRELLNVGQSVLEHYSADDVRRFGGAVVSILDTVRALTQPEVLAMATDAAQVLGQADHAQPVGLLAAVRATRDDDVKRGIALMLEVLRKVGRGVEAMGRAQSNTGTRRERLAHVLGPRRERPTPAVAAPPLSVVRAPTPSGPACSTPKPAVATQVVDGVSLTGDGYLTDASQWNRALGESLAAQQGLQLTAAHWAVIDAARGEYAQTRASPNIRRLTQIQPLSTKEIYALFPKAPGRTIAKVAGLPKPAGCL